MAVQWSLKAKYSFTDEFQKILRFYLLECPIEGVSARCHFGRISYRKTDRLKKAMMRTSGLNDTTWQVKATSEIEEALQDFGCLHQFNPAREFAIHARSRNLSHPRALIYLIRCAFAHGSFSQRTHNGTTYYALENKHQGVIKGRAVLKEETLLKWIPVIEGGLR